MMTKLEIEKYLVVSTGHITEEDMDRLDEEADDGSGESLVVLVYDEGVIVFVGTKEDMAKRAENRGFGEGLQKMLSLARKNDCQHLRLDSDGPTLEGYEVYDWWG